MVVVRRRKTSFVPALAALLVGAGCSPGPISVGDNRVSEALPDSGGMGGGGASSLDATNGAADAADAPPPTAGGLVGVTASCNTPVSNGLLSSRPSATPDVQVCGLSTAVFWKSGLAVLCAGKSTTTCNSTTDPQFHPSTTAKDSRGGYLDAAMLPYVEVSQPTMKFDYEAAGLSLGTVVAVVYKDRLDYGVVGTVGQADIIGDASYAMADALQINPDPANGGVESGVTYVAFKGPGAIVSVMESHDEAVRIGQALAAALIQAGR